MTFNRVSYKTARSTGNLYISRGISKSRKPTILSPAILFKQDNENSSDLSSSLVTNKHQYNSLKSNPNASISLSNKKRRQIFRKLKHLRFVRDEPKKEAMNVVSLDATNPFHFDFSSIVPIQNEIGTVIGI